MKQVKARHVADQALVLPGQGGQSFYLPRSKAYKTVVMASLAGIMLLGGPAAPVAAGPRFVASEGVTNPLGTVDVVNFAAPFFVDIDNDSDMDAFVGADHSISAYTYYGYIHFFRNTDIENDPTLGNNPAFVEETAGNNPFDGVLTSELIRPVFVDIDHDGDFDAFIGEYISPVEYTSNNLDFWKNKGSASDPNFVLVANDSHPFFGQAVGPLNSNVFPAFVDIDNDGDSDAFFANDNYYGSIWYFKNEGNDSVPNFARQTGANNPLDFFDGGYRVFVTGIAFVDVDADGDLDLVVGYDQLSAYWPNYDMSGIRYLRNTDIEDDQTLGNPAFVAETGPGNPFVEISENFFSTPSPAFVDLKNSGGKSLFLGNAFGKIDLFVPKSLDSPAAANDSLSAMFTLDDLYYRLKDGALGGKRGNAFQEPPAAPNPFGAGHSLDEIMSVAPETVTNDSLCAKPWQVTTGKVYWGVCGRNGFWGPKVGKPGGG